MNNGLVPAQPQAGSIVRQEFGAQQTTQVAETASTAVAARAKAEVEAAYIMAMRNPRDYMVVRRRILDDCLRPGFAKVAEYKLPRGGKTVVGQTIRFAEAAERALGNLSVDVGILYDDLDRRLVGVVVTDLERNNRSSMTFVIEKTMERRSLKQGEEAISQRVNSEGQVVYIVPVTETELAMKQASIAARVRRNLILEHLPGDIREEAVDTYRATAQRQDAEDPKGEAKKIADSFLKIGISAAELGRFLGHSVETATPDEVGDLRAAYSAMKDGEATWDDIVADRRNPETQDEKAERAKLVKRAAEIKAARPDAHEAACLAQSLQANANVETLPIAQLRQWLTIAEAKAREPRGN